MRRLTVLPLLLVTSPFGATAQVGLSRVASSTVFESYTPGEGSGFSRVTELSLPTTLRFEFGRRASLVVSGGYVRVSIDGVGPDGQVERSLSGFVDSEARLTVNLVPDRLFLLVTAAAPTGITEVAQDDVGILGPLSSDVIGFATTSLGSGGNMGFGVAGAVPVGSMALGYGASFQEAFSFLPVLGSVQDLKPGRELRLRAGLEGPLARGTYLRLATIVSGRQRDLLGGEVGNGIGHRVAGYVAIEHMVGGANLSAYAFDIYRSAPRIEPTALGTAIVPRGNTLALGTALSITLGRATTFAPRIEYRTSAIEIASSGDSQSLGSTLRFGADVRLRVFRGTTLVVEGSGLVGDFNPGIATTDLSGYRTGIHLEWTR
jgi:hypothetical protein